MMILKVVKFKNGEEIYNLRRYLDATEKPRWPVWERGLSAGSPAG
jgi:hypothetical protein